MLRLTDIIKVVAKNKLKSVYFSGYENIRINKHFGKERKMNFLKNRVLFEMNKTVMADEIGSMVGFVNNYKIVNRMSIIELIKHNIRIMRHKA